MFGVWEKLADWWSIITLNGGNGGLTKINNGPGSYEERIGVMGNGSEFPWKRWFYNATDGMEYQVSNNADFAHVPAQGLLTFNVLSLAAQPNVNANIETRGFNLDAVNLDGRFAVRNADGSADLGAVRVAPNGANGFQMIFSIRDNAGVLQDCLVLDPSVDSSGAVAARIGGGMHRLRRVQGVGGNTWVATAE